VLLGRIEQPVGVAPKGVPPTILEDAAVAKAMSNNRRGLSSTILQKWDQLLMVQPPSSSMFDSLALESGSVATRRRAKKTKKVAKSASAEQAATAIPEQVRPRAADWEVLLEHNPGSASLLDSLGLDAGHSKARQSAREAARGPAKLAWAQGKIVLQFAEVSDACSTVAPGSTCDTLPDFPECK